MNHDANSDLCQNETVFNELLDGRSLMRLGFGPGIPGIFLLTPCVEKSFVLKGDIASPILKTYLSVYMSKYEIK